MYDTKMIDSMTDINNDMTDIATTYTFQSFLIQGLTHIIEYTKWFQGLTCMQANVNF